MNHRSRVAIIAACLAVVGCADGAKIVQDRDDGGVVVYPFKGEQGHLLSSFRKDALSLMQQKCGGAYTIVREGETKSRSQVAETVRGSQEMIQERRWGIEFRCK
ncbi:MAG TPA: hypothetical protein VEI50_03790 [Nitrospiraceae bacterium]|nr:hypothetical protein [Nitrospiraceae bacterium]